MIGHPYRAEARGAPRPPARPAARAPGSRLAVRLAADLAALQRRLISDAIAGRCSHAEAFEAWRAALGDRREEWGVVVA